MHAPLRQAAQCSILLVLPLLAACSGGGATTGSGGNATIATATPHTGPVSGSTPTASPTPSPMGTGASSQSGAIAAPTSPPNAPGYANVVPTPPAAGTCRTGQIYSIYVSTPTSTTDTEAFTVFEPASLCAGQTYPLVMWGPGYSASRQTSLSTDPVSGTLSPGNIASMVAANYGVVSIDQRGFGEDTGTVRVMDPNFEGLMDLSVMDWAQANLTWLKYAPTLEGDDPHEPVMGSIGGSYGGMYQKMLLNLDKRHRLRAIVPQISPNDLNYSLFPNAVVKDAWDLDLYTLGESGGSNTNRVREDPFLQQAVIGGITANAEAPATHDFFGYHSSDYFCNQATIGSDGDAGSTTLFAPTYPPKVNAMIWQGMRDTLFTMNNAIGDYRCWAKNGGDVRLLSYTYGHNSLQVVPDPYLTVFYSETDITNKNCGSLDVDTATVAFFNQYLKGMAGAASSIPTMPCFALGNGGQGVLVPSVVSGTAGTPFVLPSTTVVAGSAPDIATTIALGPAATTAGVLAGLPYMKLNVTPLVATGEPILFLGIGILHASNPTVYDLLDNQITPIRGAGEHDIDMTGIASRVAVGDQVALLVYGQHDQYYAAGDVNVAAPAVVPSTISGTVYLPYTSAVTAP